MGWLIGISCLLSPQGLGVYWLTNSTLTAAQTLIARAEADSEFPELKEMWDKTDDEPEQVKQGDQVVLSGRDGVVVYGPDTDGECKVQFEDGSESGFVKINLLRRKGTLVDKAVSKLEEEEEDAVPKLYKEAKSRSARRAGKKQQKKRGKKQFS